MRFDVKALSWEGQESFAHFVVVELRKRMNKPKKCSRDSAQKTRTGVNGFPHADPAVRVRTHPARASVQRS